MVFAQNRPASQAKTQKRSSLKGWLGRKNVKEEAGPLPEVDVSAGVNRALRTAATAPETSAKTDDTHVREALSVIEATLFSIDKIRDILEQACEVALSAQSVEDAGGRALLAESYDELRLSINAAIEKLDEHADILVGKNQRHQDVLLGGKARYSITPTRLDISESGLNLSPPRDAFATFEEIATVLEQLDTALKKADRAANGYCRDAQFLMARMRGAQD